MYTVEQRLARIENMLARALHAQVPAKQKERMAEKEVMEKYNISRIRLKQLRLGFTRFGIQYGPVLFKWGHINGRRIDYDTGELEAYFKRFIHH